MLSQWPESKRKNDFTFWLIFSLSPNLGLRGKVSAKDWSKKWNNTIVSWDSWKQQLTEYVTCKCVLLVQFVHRVGARCAKHPNFSWQDVADDSWTVFFCQARLAGEGVMFWSCLSVRSSIRCETCQHDILITSELILMQIDTSDPQCKVNSGEQELKDQDHTNPKYVTKIHFGKITREISNYL